MKLRYLKNLIVVSFFTLFTSSLNAQDDSGKTTDKPAEEITETLSEKAAKKPRGIGLATARLFAEHGANIVVLDLAMTNPVDVAAELGADHMGIACDVTDRQACQDAAAAVIDRYGQVDILINNAGYFGPNKIGTKQDGIATITRKEIEFCFAVNTMGPIFVTQALLPNLQAGTKKKVINMSTRSSIISRARGGAMGYRVSKAGLNMVTSTLHGELHKKGFIVASVAPGHNKTDMGSENGKLQPEDSMPLLKKVIENLNKKQSSGFWYYDGSRLPW